MEAINPGTCTGCKYKIINIEGGRVTEVQCELGCSKVHEDTGCTKYSD